MGTWRAGGDRTGGGRTHRGRVVIDGEGDRVRGERCEAWRARRSLHRPDMTVGTATDPCVATVRTRCPAPSTPVVSTCIEIGSLRLPVQRDTE
ncbi:hypothetical protein GCM10009549_18100 [Streptomyces thermoalcalitolerans]|uniref:Uncharacterized protein n=1 Tax=Streptomyces thermoalcalitolerans TaxID=65605 RepID=A0ABP3Z0X6_9ACTN